MNPSSVPFELLKNPWSSTYRRMLEEVTGDLFLVSPYIKGSAVDQLLTVLQRRHADTTVKVVVLTRLSLNSIIDGALDVDALVQMGDHLPQFALTHLPSLHAKVYVADHRTAVVTSGNLTNGGLCENLEYGVYVTEEEVVTEIRRDFEKYSALGARISTDELRALARSSGELKTAYQAAQRSIRAQAHEALRERLQETRLSILRYRAKGRTTQAILCDTLLFLLERGPLRTQEIHPFVQQIHPDICDDATDRIIDGVHFGKKWKHHVRSAQQALSRQARICFDGQRWHLTGGG